MTHSKRVDRLALGLRERRRDLLAAVQAADGDAASLALALQERGFRQRSLLAEVLGTAPGLGLAFCLGLLAYSGFVSFGVVVARSGIETGIFAGSKYCVTETSGSVAAYVCTFPETFFDGKGGR